MILLDTNVLSELMRPKPADAVHRWVAERPASSLFTSTVTQAEILYGLALLPAGRRRDDLAAAVGRIFEIDFAGRLLPFDADAAVAYARIVAGRRAAGRPISHMDAQVASIAVSREASIATRNTQDFEGCGVTVLNPWSG